MQKLIAALAALFAFVCACGSPGHPATSPTTPFVNVVPATTTTTAMLAAPANEFLVASPVSSPLQYSATPGGPPEGTLPTVTWGNPTVRPVIGHSPGWVQIELDSRPNGSTAWVPSSAVNLAVTAYRIVISVGQRNLTVYRDGQATYTAPVGVGKVQWPTPLGLTFVDAVVATPKNQLYIYGPTVLILGTHSNVFTDFDGGDGTVAIHGYPSDPGSTQGVMSSHGCVRVSPQTIDAIDTIPLGSPVDVVA